MYELYSLSPNRNIEKNLPYLKNSFIFGARKFIFIGKNKLNV